MASVGRMGRWVIAAAAILAAATGGADVPVVVFDVPLISECRDVTPQGFREAYQRMVIEAVFRLSPQLVAGQEKDLKQLRYEISTDQQMPVVGFLPNSQVTTDVVNGTIAIQNASHHGEVSFRYLITPAAGNGDLKGDLESSRAQFGLLAPRQLLMAAGTIDRGCGVYFDLRPSSQDTLQKQRDFACLFDVPTSWRADHVTIRCQAKGIKHGLGGLLESEVGCGAGLLCVGLFKQNDGEARAYAEKLARQQQVYLIRMAQQANARSKATKSAGIDERVANMDRMSVTKGNKSAIFDLEPAEAVRRPEVDAGESSETTKDIQAASEAIKAAQQDLRMLNGKTK